jgi:epoxyqueuosine reductase
VDLATRIDEVASRAGFAGIGFCSADPFSETRRDLQARVAGGLHAGMRFTFGDPATACDVRRSFPWARSLVVGARSYLPAAGSPGPPAPGTGRIARFATEDHYAGLRSGLDAIAAQLTAAGHRAATLADDNRLVDRAAAVRAGVVWWGKNTMGLAPGAGPWLLLGSVATDAAFPASPPMQRDCGRCSACLPACPTGALVAPGVLDARRCLAHLLQAPGVIPRPLRAAVGDRIYGCDDCLEACPPGRRLLRRAADPRGRVDVAGLLSCDDRSLLARFGHFYIPRRRARFLRRNALVVLGNTGGRSAVAVASGYAAHPDPLLRAHAVWALGRLGGPLARAALARVAARGDEPMVAEEVAPALAAAEDAC